MYSISKGEIKPKVHSHNGTPLKAKEGCCSPLWHIAAQIHFEILSWKSLGKGKTAFGDLFCVAVGREWMKLSPLPKWAVRSHGSEAGEDLIASS